MSINYSTGDLSGYIYSLYQNKAFFYTLYIGKALSVSGMVGDFEQLS